MINVNELRIGNWVEHYGKEGKVQRIDAWNKSVTTLNEDGSTFGATEAQDINPLPLTEGGLTKWGFEWDQVTHGKGKVMVGQRRDGTWSVYYGTFSYGFLDECVVTYVHQLQNIYFALTGQELEVQDAG